jgi:hypothetical protein
VKANFVEREAFLESVAIATVEKRMNFSEELSFIKNLSIRF